eukprot:m.84578 g.84578  ORF g.84578 m.84578 type:complete len:78 (-) comp14810_c0_seq2:228-461(-)
MLVIGIQPGFSFPELRFLSLKTHTRSPLDALLQVPLLMFMFVIGIVTFYEVQNTEFCTWCESINCIQYTSDIACETF